MNEPTHRGQIVRDEPLPATPGDRFWGSDHIAAVVRELDIPYIALVPGSSYRGFHDSIVNYLGNRAPQMVLTVHEENAVAIAHGYAKASDRMMAAALHANIGLMRATMAVYNAWCDRAPLMILGATGPWDATKRRPWIDWIHTSSDQGGLIRNFTKWDNQPGSPVAAMEAVLRANQIAQTVLEKIDPLGVAVVCEGTHLCMSMRGVEKQNSFAVTSAMLGIFRDNARTRMEFLELIRHRGDLAQSVPIGAGLTCVND